MIKYEFTKLSNVIYIYNESGNIVVLFTQHGPEFGIFKNGLVAWGGASLYDRDAKRYVIGTVDMLDDGGDDEEA